MGCPRMVPVPDVGWIRPRSIRIAVVFPAPLRPMKPVTDPVGTWRSRSATTIRVPYFFVSRDVSMAGSDRAVVFTESSVRCDAPLDLNVTWRLAGERAEASPISRKPPGNIEPVARVG